MSERVADFMWQVMALLVFVSSITLLMLVVNGIDQMNAEMNAQLSDGRVVIEKSETNTEKFVEGHCIYMMLRAGIDSPIVVDNHFYSPEDEVGQIDFAIDKQYQVTYSVNPEGYLQLTTYERID